MSLNETQTALWNLIKSMAHDAHANGFSTTQFNAQHNIRKITHGNHDVLNFADDSGKSLLRYAFRPGIGMDDGKQNKNQTATLRALIKEGANPMFDRDTFVGLINFTDTKTAAWIIEEMVANEARGWPCRDENGRNPFHRTFPISQSTFSRLLKEWPLEGMPPGVRDWLFEPDPITGDTVLQVIARWTVINSRRKPLAAIEVSNIQHALAYIADTADNDTPFTEPAPCGKSAIDLIEEAMELGKLPRHLFLSDPAWERQWARIQAERLAAQLDTQTTQGVAATLLMKGRRL